jgi:hypothetical protein
VDWSPIEPGNDEVDTIKRVCGFGHIVVAAGKDIEFVQDNLVVTEDRKAAGIVMAQVRVLELAVVVAEKFGGQSPTLDHIKKPIHLIHYGLISRVLFFIFAVADN